MKKVSLYLLLLTLLAVPTLQSCDDNDNNHSNGYLIAMATVKKTSTDATGLNYLQLDNGKTMWIEESYVPFSKLPAGQRILGNYTILEDNQGGYDYLIRLNAYNSILTKGIIDLTAANADSIGDTKVRYSDMWVGATYLNIEVERFVATNKAQMVNLVRNTTITYPADGYAHLEFHLKGDNSGNGRWVPTLVSFQLGDLSPAIKVNVKGLIVRFNTPSGEKIVTIDYTKENGNSKSLSGLKEPDNGMIE